MREGRQIGRARENGSKSGRDSGRLQTARTIGRHRDKGHDELKHFVHCIFRYVSKVLVLSLLPRLAVFQQHGWIR